MKQNYLSEGRTVHIVTYLSLFNPHYGIALLKETSLHAPDPCIKIRLYAITIDLLELHFLSLQTCMLLHLSYISSCAIIGHEIEPKLVDTTSWYKLPSCSEKNFSLEDWTCRYLEVIFPVMLFFAIH